MGYWAQPPVPRDQMVLFATTLEERISEDHPVRLLQELLAGRDWSGWEAHYCRLAGQPAIHPSIVAGAILYGLSQGIRSSRRLEWVCENSIDLMWLIEGRHIDHSTFCKFRTRFESELKDLFKQVIKLALGMGLVRFNQVGLDGTKVKANSSGNATVTAATLEERSAALNQQIDEMFAQIARKDAQDQDMWGDHHSPTHLPRELADMKKRLAAMEKALEMARATDLRRSQRSEGPKEKKAAKVAVADPEAPVLPNKEGGHAPNYTPLAATDGHKDFIVDADVYSTEPEGTAALPTVDRIEENFGAMPEQLLADTTFATGQNLEGLESRGVEAIMPVEATRLDEKNPVRRPDPRVPVAEADWPKLPRNSHHQLDRAAFVYDAAQDCYYCPMGRRLEPGKQTHKQHHQGESVYQHYRAVDCSGCPLAGECLGKKSKQRTVARDQYEPQRERLAARMAQPEKRRCYGRRAWMAETVNAVIKGHMGMRQFLLRGLQKVRMEWLWICSAFNIRKLIQEVAALRARFAAAVG